MRITECNGGWLVMPETMYERRYLGSDLRALARDDGHCAIGSFGIHAPSSSVPNSAMGETPVLDSPEAPTAKHIAA